MSVRNRKKCALCLEYCLNKSVATNYLGEVSAHIRSLNLSFNALDDDVSNATKDKVALERSIKISKQFSVTQGVTWEETAEGWRKIKGNAKVY